MTTAPRPAVYSGRKDTDDRHAWLRAGHGYGLVSADPEQGGVWLSDGKFCQHFPDIGAAMRAVNAGWPRLAGRGGG